MDFRFSWVITDVLAVGNPPLCSDHLDRLEAEGIRAVLSLCSELEAALPRELAERFAWTRCVLPDHTWGRAPHPQEMLAALQDVRALSLRGPVYLHCVAAVERSPLVAIAWLMREKALSRLDALDYLMQVHPGSCPLPDQLAILDDLPHATGIPAFHAA
jgi:hypothetical protein